MRFNFCFVSDKFFLPNLLVLLSSFFNDNIRIHVLCLDNYTYDYFKKSHNLKINIYKKKDVIKNNRINKKKNTKIEFLLKPIFIHYIYKNINTGYLIVYIDSDIAIYAPIKSFLKFFTKKHSIFLAPHNFSKNICENIKYGIFNAGFIAFKKDIFSLEALNWWKNSCLKVCVIDVKRNLIGDQTYLNLFPKKFKNVHIINNQGFNCAPWNIYNKNFIFKKKIMIKNTTLIFFHFQGLRKLFLNFYYTNFSSYKLKPSPNLKKFYFIYISRLEKQRALLKNIKNKFSTRLFIKAILYNDFILSKKSNTTV